MSKATIIFKHNDWTSNPVRIDAEYETVKALLKNFYVYNVDPEQSLGQFIAEYARTTNKGDFIDLTSSRRLSDYFALTDNYRLFSAERVRDLTLGYDTVYLVVLNENEDNIRVQMFEYEADKPRWFTVKR